MDRLLSSVSLVCCGSVSLMSISTLISSYSFSTSYERDQAATFESHNRLENAKQRALGQWVELRQQHSVSGKTVTLWSYRVSFIICELQHMIYGIFHRYNYCIKEYLKTA